MDNLSLSDLALSWYQHSPLIYSGDPAENKLFAMLYNTHCRRTGSGKSFCDLAHDTDRHKACTELYEWYHQRYGETLHMPTGTRGQKRIVTHSSGEYTFDLLYCDARQFKSYLLTGIPQSGSQDLLAFVLHTAVAFLVPLAELDSVLQHLGFHPLHVKNIHHLAIAYVLLSAEIQPPDAAFNPFAEVRRLYLQAHELLNAPQEADADAYSFDDLLTRIIRKDLLLQKGLPLQNFGKLIARNSAALNMRHSIILADFYRLKTVFIHIFDCAAADLLPQTEEAYSFYAFVKQFCKDDLRRKKFREHLTGMVDRNEKHPTRSVLILLWLYAYCFSFLPGVNISRTTYRAITKDLRKGNPAWADDAKKYYRDDLFDVYGFLTNTPGRTVPQDFRGSDFIAYINELLLMRYGWGQLNGKLPFDYFILRLAPLTLQIAPGFAANHCSGAAYGGDRLTGLHRGVDNVPYPLVAITQLYGALKQLLAAKAALRKYTKLPVCPLKCGLYEQL